ncbi:MAG TPA: MFS transporter [Pseudonocardia sp.]|jgi:MFS family permease
MTGTRDEAAERPGTGGSWFKRMRPNERRTFWACFAGWATDATDVQIFSLLIPVLVSTGFLTGTGQSGLIATITLLSSSVGGWIAGILADRIGRVRTLQLTIAWYSFFTLLCAVAWDPVSLGVFRALMGLGFGGEWAVGAVLMAETVRADVRGRAVGTVQSGWAIGWAVAVGLFVLTSTLLPPEYAWRALFALGFLPAVLVIFIRRGVQEPQVRRAAPTTSASGGVLKIFSPPYLGRTLACSLLAVGAQGGYYALTTFLPKFLADTRGLKVLALGSTLFLVISGAFVGYLIGAQLTDRLGRRRTLMVTAAGAFVVVLPFLLLDLGPALFTVLCFPLGLFSSAYFSAIGPLFSEQYPTELRASGQGFCYNFGRGIGALFPFAVGVLATPLGIATAIAIFAGVAYALLGIMAALVRERTDVDLDAIDEPTGGVRPASGT